MRNLTTISPLPKDVEKWLVERWQKEMLTDNQPERLSPEDTKFIYRKPDGSIEPVRFLKFK